MVQDKELRFNVDSNVSVFREQANIMLVKSKSFLMSKEVRSKESYPYGKVRIPTLIYYVLQKSNYFAVFNVYTYAKMKVHWRMYGG